MSQSKNEAIQDEEELAAHRATAQVASQAAARQAQRGQGHLLEQISDPDIFNGSDEILEEQLGIDFARSHALAQKDESDVWRDRWLNENEADRIIHEHNPGRLCFGPFLELAQGVNKLDAQAQTPMTDAAKRKTREGLKAKTAYQTMSKNGRTFAGITEIVTTNKVERNDESEDSGGRLSKVRNKLFG